MRCRMSMKKSLRKRLLACVALIAVMAMLLCGCGKKGGSGSGRATSADGAVSTATALYGDIIDLCKKMLNGQGDMYTSTDMRLILSEDAKDLIADLAQDGGAEMDIAPILDVLDGATIGTEFAMQDDLAKVLLNLSHTDDKGSVTDLISMDVILDLAKGDGYLAIPQLLQGYAKIPGMTDSLTAMMGSTDQVAGVLEALPSEDVLNRLLDKYVQLAMKQFKSTEKTETVTAAGVEQKLTVKECAITHETLVKGGIVLLTELRNDAEIKKAVQKLDEQLGTDLYNEMCDGLDDLLEELSAVEEFDTESVATLKQYFNGDRLAGLSLSGDGVGQIRLVSTEKGDKFGFELSVAGYAMVGTGTQKKGVTNATFEIKSAEETLGQIIFTDVKDNGGTIRVIPGKNLLNMLFASMEAPASVSTLVSMMNLSLQMEVKATDTKSEMNLYVLSGEEKFLGVEMVTKFENKKIRVPASKDVYEEEEWLATLNADALLKALKKIGLPAELCDQLEAMLEGGLSGDAFGVPDYDMGGLLDEYENFPEYPDDMDFDSFV